MFLEQTINKENSSQRYYKLNKVKLLQKNYESKFNFSQVKFTSKLLSLRDASFFLSNFRAVPNVSENRQRKQQKADVLSKKYIFLTVLCSARGDLLCYFVKEIFFVELFAE